MKHLVLVFSNPVKGQEDEYDRWYEDVHLGEMLATTGWQGAQRFALADEMWNACPHGYLAVYEAEADDPKSVLPHLNATRAKRQQNAAFDKKTAAVWVFSEIGPEHKNPAFANVKMGKPGTKRLVTVFSNPTEGQEAEYNRWYEDVHLNGVLATAGWRTARRFALTDDMWNACPLKYLALYEAVTDDPKAVLAKLNATRAKRQQSEAIDIKTAAVWVFSEIGHRRQGAA